MEILVIIITIVATAATVYFIAARRGGSATTDQSLLQEMELYKSAKIQLETENNLFRRDLDLLKNELKEEREKLSNANNRLAKAEEVFLHKNEKIKELESLHEKLTKEFENIANKVLRQNSEEISLRNKESLEITLKPLGEQIKSFEEKIAKNAEEREGLKELVKTLHDLNKNMAEEAKNLTNALKGDTKSQGNWGEFILEKVLETSGLKKGVEYSMQESYTNAEGKRLQPDVIINLPRNKKIIIDSKVSLVAYEKYVSEDDKLLKQKYVLEHIASIRAHIKGLAEKNYQHIFEHNTLDFVLLFMPIESAFSLAVQNDPNLFNEAFERRIVIVSTSTLLATLKTIESIWRQEKQNRNAIKIADEAGKMFDKFVLFEQDMRKLGTQINTAQRTYDETYKKLHTGTGNLIKRAETLKELGARTSKELDEDTKTLGEEEE